jgi:iron complex transport system permease protein
MDDWYVIGVAVGVGVSLGVLAAGLLASSRFGVAGSTSAGVILGIAAGVVANRWIDADWLGPLAGVLGGVVGALCATVLVRGALRRGGTSGGTAFLVASAALMLFTLALVPIAGYVEAVVLPVLAARARRRAPRRHAGLRTLAK